MDALEKIVTVGFPILIAGAIGFYFNFAGGYSKAYFDERDRKRKHELNAAIEVHKICNEASTNSFGVRPRNMEHINSVMTDVDGVNKKMGIKFREMISSWVMIAGEGGRSGNSADEFSFFLDHFDRAEAHRKALVEWSSKIRTGK